MFSYYTGADVSLVSTFVVVPEGNSGTTDVEMCIELSLVSPTILDRDVELLLNTVSTTASKSNKLHAVSTEHPLKLVNSAPPLR